MTEQTKLDIKGDVLKPGEHVVFCQAGSSKLMTMGWINRVLPKSVEVAYTKWDQYAKKHVTEFVYRDPANVCRIEPKAEPVDE